MRSRRGVSPVLATLLMVAVAVSMSVIIFTWSQGFLASTSEAASSQQQAQNVAAQSSINIEAIQFLDDDLDDDGIADETITVNGVDLKEDVDGGENDIDKSWVKIVVRNVGTSKVTIGQVYMGTSAYEMIPYPAYKIMRSDAVTFNAAKHVIIGDVGTDVWFVSNAAATGPTANTTDNEGYQGHIYEIWSSYDNLHATDPLQEENTVWAFIFTSTGSADTEGELDPQGFAVLLLCMDPEADGGEIEWSPGETYYVKVVTTVGTFADATVTAPAS